MVWYAQGGKVMGMNAYFAAAGGLSIITFAVHFWLGGAQIARPLLNGRELNRVVKLTHYYCWHLVSIALILLAVAFLAAAARGPATVLGAGATAAAALATLWNLALVIAHRVKPWLMPQWALFAPIAVLGALGLML
jgi:hypothetical protein